MANVGVLRTLDFDANFKDDCLGDGAQRTHRDAFLQYMYVVGIYLRFITWNLRHIEVDSPGICLCFDFARDTLTFR